MIYNRPLIKLVVMKELFLAAILIFAFLSMFLIPLFFTANLIFYDIYWCDPNSEQAVHAVCR